MQDILTLEEIIVAVLGDLRKQTSWTAVSLAEIHSKCLEAAEDLSPDLLDTLSSVKGLRALIPALQALPELVLPSDEELGMWTIVR